jgi:hypothetical protein
LKTCRREISFVLLPLQLPSIKDSRLFLPKLNISYFLRAVRIPNRNKGVSWVSKYMQTRHDIPLKLINKWVKLIEKYQVLPGKQESNRLLIKPFSLSKTTANSPTSFVSFNCRRKALQMLVGRMRMALRPIRRTHATLQKTHRSQAFQVSPLRPVFFTQRSPRASHEKTHLSCINHLQISFQRNRNHQSME